MDSFVKPTMPDLRPNLSQGLLERGIRKIGGEVKQSRQIEDVRYPGYAAVMKDARLVTDYKSQCENNVVPSEYGNSFRSWLQHNGEAFIQTSRHRQAEANGAYYRDVDTTIPAKQTQACDAFECMFSRTGIQDSVGLQRTEHVPELFGTFAQPDRNAPAKHIPLTSTYEGGRNSLRGQTFVPLGTQSFQRKMYDSSG